MTTYAVPAGLLDLPAEILTMVVECVIGPKETRNADDPSLRKWSFKSQWREDCMNMRLTCNAISCLSLLTTALFHTVRCDTSERSLERFRKVTDHPSHRLLVRRLHFRKSLISKEFWQDPYWFGYMDTDFVNCSPNIPVGCDLQALLDIKNEEYYTTRTKQLEGLRDYYFNDIWATGLSKLPRIEELTIEGPNEVEEVWSGLEDRQRDLQYHHTPDNVYQYWALRVITETSNLHFLNSVLGPLAGNNVALRKLKVGSLAGFHSNFRLDFFLSDIDNPSIGYGLRLHELRSLDLDLCHYHDSPDDDNWAILVNPFLARLVNLEDLALSWSGKWADSNIMEDCFSNTSLLCLQSLKLENLRADATLLADFLRRHALLRKLCLIDVALWEPTDAWRDVFVAIRESDILTEFDFDELFSRGPKWETYPDQLRSRLRLRTYPPEEYELEELDAFLNGTGDWTEALEWRWEGENVRQFVYFNVC